MVLDFKKKEDSLDENFQRAVRANEKIQACYRRHLSGLMEEISNLEEEPDAHELSNAQVAEQLRCWVLDLNSILALLRSEVDDMTAAYEAMKETEN